MDDYPDIDSFVIGNKEVDKHIPLEYNLPQIVEYMKRTGKSFDELTDEEKLVCKL